MHPRTPSLRRLPAGLPGLLLVVFALAMQLAVVSVVPSGDAVMGIDRLVAASICHSGGTDQGGTPAHRHAPDCAVCPLCQAIAHAGVLLAAPPVWFAGPAVFVAHAYALPPARAPPPRRIAATTARGPPDLF